jgi:hypothetical protein
VVSVAPAGTRKLLVALILTLATALTGCVTFTDFETAQEHKNDTIGLVSPGKPISQSFVARHPGLNGFYFWAGAINSTDLPLLVEFFHHPSEPQPIFSQTIPISKFGQVEAALPSQNNQPGQEYLVRLSTNEGEIQVAGRQENAYPHGQAFFGEMPLDADLAFKTTYRYTLPNLLIDTRNFISLSWLALPLIITLLAPGWLLLAGLGLTKHFDGGEQIALALGLSLSLAPIFILWTTILGIHWSRGGVYFGAGLLAVGVLWRAALTIKTWRISRAGIGLILILAVSLVVRLIMVRDLSAPAWVDSIHHALITRLILEQGAFPETYSPYLSIDPSIYHPGFHIGLAIFIWLSNLDIPQAMLIYGQVLNAGAVLAAYLLTTTLTGNRPAGLAAALITGLVAPMPAYYASWGRYTQLAGLLILPVAAAFAFAALERKDIPRVKSLVMAVAGTAGLLLVHYRVAAFFACLLIAWFFLQIRFNKISLVQHLRKSLGAAFALGGGAFVLSFPWITPAFIRHILPSLQLQLGLPSVAFEDFSWLFLTAGLGNYALGLAAFGFAWSLVRRQRLGALISLWICFLFLLANLGALGLPGSWLVNTHSVTIALFLPLSVLGGYFISNLLNTWPGFLPIRFQLPYQVVGIMALLVLGLFGGRALLTILNPVTLLFREWDRPALAWIAENIPPEETILINPFNWGYGVYAGNDGGYWISALSGHKTMPPPVLYGMGNAEETRRISAYAGAVIERAQRPQDLHLLLADQNIRFVYLGGRGGQLSARLLNESELFSLLYGENGAWVFEIARETQQDQKSP